MNKGEKLKQRLELLKKQVVIDNQNREQRELNLETENLINDLKKDIQIVNKNFEMCRLINSVYDLDEISTLLYDYMLDKVRPNRKFWIFQDLDLIIKQKVDYHIESLKELKKHFNSKINNHEYLLDKIFLFFLFKAIHALNKELQGRFIIRIDVKTGINISEFEYCPEDHERQIESITNKINSLTVGITDFNNPNTSTIQYSITPLENNLTPPKMGTLRIFNLNGIGRFGLINSNYQFNEGLFTQIDLFKEQLTKNKQPIIRVQVRPGESKYVKHNSNNLISPNKSEPKLIVKHDFKDYNIYKISSIKLDYYIKGLKKYDYQISQNEKMVIKNFVDSNNIKSLIVLTQINN